jgi:hypothetical protein
MGQFTFVACSYKKLEPKNAIFKGLGIFSRKLFFAITFDRNNLQRGIAPFRNQRKISYIHIDLKGKFV